MKKNSIKVLLLLHLLLMIYSLSGVFTKTASGKQFLSFGFILCYGMTIVILGIYAIGWQQIIKRLPLTTAFANKAITVVWGIIWGLVFFKEKITPGKLIGAAIVIVGVVMYVKADAELENENTGTDEGVDKEGEDE